MLKRLWPKLSTLWLSYNEQQGLGIEKIILLRINKSVFISVGYMYLVVWCKTDVHVPPDP